MFEGRQVSLRRKTLKGSSWEAGFSLGGGASTPLQSVAIPKTF